MTKEDFINIVSPTIEHQTLNQFNQLKNFIDSSLKDAVSKPFENDTEKINYLLNTIFSVRDFTLAVTTENSVRVSLIKSFERLEKEIESGNELRAQKEKLSPHQEEKLEQDQQD